MVRMVAKRILIVDDEADVRTLLGRVLAPLGEVFQASNGAEALDLFAKHRPQVVFLDVTMPGASGFDVLEQLRQLAPSAAVVMLTSHHDLDLARLALEQGASAYVTKPFDVAYIRAEASRLLAARTEGPNQKPWKVR